MAARAYCQFLMVEMIAAGCGFVLLCTDSLGESGGTVRNKNDAIGGSQNAHFKIFFWLRSAIQGRRILMPGDIPLYSRVTPSAEVIEIAGELLVDEKERRSADVLNGLLGDVVEIRADNGGSMEIVVLRAIGNPIEGRYRWVPAPGNFPLR